jgi:citrate synthase
MSSKPDRPNTDIWDRNRGVIRSSKGGWIAGKGVFSHGYDMMLDLVGRVSYMQVIILNATGRLPSEKIAKWCEAAFICLSWPDPRIWCNHIGALAGSSRCSPVSATAAGSLASDSLAYGPRTLAEGLAFIQSARKKQLQGYSAKDIVRAECRIKGKTPTIIGYARPIAKGDERVDALERTVRELGFTIGPHLSLAYEIENYMLEQYDESMNMSGFGSGFLADLDFNFTPKEVYRVGSCLISSGVTACYCDTDDKAAHTFLPMYCDDIDYQGKENRTVPGK